MRFWKWLRRERDEDRTFSEFVTFWDRLEVLVIRVYRGEIGDRTAREEFDAVWPWLRRVYPRWQNELDPHWRATRAAGAPTASDPFLLLLDLDSPSAIQDSWRAMQHLPAAREAVNRYLLEQ